MYSAPATRNIVLTAYDMISHIVYCTSQRLYCRVFFSPELYYIDILVAAFPPYDILSGTSAATLLPVQYFNIRRIMTLAVALRTKEARAIFRRKY